MAGLLSITGMSAPIAAAIGSLYGEEAGNAFLPLWRKHIGFFMAYILGLVAEDAAAQEQGWLRRWPPKAPE